MIATTTQEIRDIVNRSFDFDVVKKRFRNPITGGPTGHFGLFRSDNGACVGNAVSERYTPHNRDDVLAMAEAAATAFEGKRMVVSCSFRDGHKVVIGPTDESRIEIAKNDGIFPRFILSAGYDSSPFSSTFGAYRDACTNLQILDSVSSVNERLRHVRSLRDKMPELIDMFGAAASNWERTGEVARQMRQRKVDIRSFIETIYPVPEEDSKRTGNMYLVRVERIMSRIARERLASGNLSNNWKEATAWEAYQGIQGYVQHDQRRNGRPDRLQRALLALESPQVKLALELATAS